MPKKLIVIFSCLMLCALVWGGVALYSDHADSKIEMNDIDLVYSVVKKDHSKGIVSFVLANDGISSIYKKAWQDSDGAIHIELYKKGAEGDRICKEKIPGLVYGIRKDAEVTYSPVDGFSFTVELEASRPCDDLYIGSRKMQSVNLLWNSPSFKDEFIMYDIEGFDN